MALTSGLARLPQALCPRRGAPGACPRPLQPFQPRCWARCACQPRSGTRPVRPRRARCCPRGRARAGAGDRDSPAAWAAAGTAAQGSPRASQAAPGCAGASRPLPTLCLHVPPPCHAPGSWERFPTAFARSSPLEPGSAPTLCRYSLSWAHLGVLHLPRAASWAAPSGWALAWALHASHPW